MTIFTKQDHENQWFVRKSSVGIFEESMQPYLIQFKNVIENSFEMMLRHKGTRKPDYINRGWEANQMNSNIRGLLKEACPDNFKTTTSGRFYFLKEGQYIILFKKLDSKFMPSNKPTKFSENLITQGDFGFKIPVVFVGYRPNASWDNLNYIMAVYISSKRVEWKCNLRDMAEGKSVKQLTVNNSHPNEPEVKIKVS